MSLCLCGDTQLFGWDLITILMVVLLAVDIVTGMTQFLPEPLAFFRSELPVSPIKSLIDANSGLLGL